MTQTVYEIITGLQAAKGTKAKSAILLENAGNIELNSYLRAVFEPTVNYYIAKMKFEETPEGDVANLGSWLNLMDKLASREVTGNEARNYLQGVYNALNNEQRVLLKLLINRNIKAGVAAGSINKVMPGLIREVPYQRCCLPKDSNLSKLDWSKGVIVQLKADGSFANMYTGGQPIVETRNGKTVWVPAETVIWAAGVKASPAAAWLGAEADRAGRVKVEPDYSVPGHGNVFVIGDTASLVDADERLVPGVAPAAKQAGHYVGGVIRAALAGRSKPAPFRYRDPGNMATIGRHAGVADFGWVSLRGRVAWWLWGIVHIYFLIDFRSRLTVSINWLWSFLTFKRGARLITSEQQSATRE